MNCPKCGTDVTDTFEPDDYSCGIVGGWYCDACDLGIAEWEHPREPLEDDVEIVPSGRAAQPIGTPISEISGRPGHEGFAEFCRIAKTWGHE